MIKNNLNLPIYSERNRNLRSGILRKKFGNVRKELGGGTFGKKSETVGNTSFMGHSERNRKQSSHRIRKQSESEFFPNSFLTFPNVFRKLSVSFRRILSETFPFFPLGSLVFDPVFRCRYQRCFCCARIKKGRISILSLWFRQISYN